MAATKGKTDKKGKTDTKQEHKTKKFGKGERSIPHHTQKARKFYPAEDEKKNRKVSCPLPSRSLETNPRVALHVLACSISQGR